MDMSSNDSPKEKDLRQLADRVIYIVGPRSLQNELMAFFLHHETGATCMAMKNARRISLGDKREIYKPVLILFDCLEKKLEKHLSELESNLKTILKQHYIALFNISHRHGIEKKALKQGVRGFFYEHDPLRIFPKGINVIFNGQLWASRRILSKTILEIKDKDIVTKKEASILTPREAEILSMAAAGITNEQIARELFISANTVRTHIYNIFKKINVPNRLQASLWAAKNL
jgi:DNA-binding NarL/FixJ family response regulator